MQWRSGNAAVCKTAMREFDSRLHLQKNKERSDYIFLGLRENSRSQKVFRTSSLSRSKLNLHARVRLSIICVCDST